MTTGQYSIHTDFASVLDLVNSQLKSEKKDPLPISTCMLRATFQTGNVYRGELSTLGVNKWMGAVDTGYLFQSNKCGWFSRCPRENSHANKKIIKLKGDHPPANAAYEFTSDGEYSQCRFSLGKFLVYFGVTGGLLLGILIILSQYPIKPKKAK